MSVVTRIGPGSAFKVGVVVYAIMGLAFGVLCSGLAFAVPLAHMPFSGAFRLLPVVLCPIVHGLIGGIVTVVGALIYNLASGWVGGLEVDMR